MRGGGGTGLEEPWDAPAGKIPGELETHEPEGDAKAH